MRLSQGLILAGALFVAAPAIAQDNAAAPGAPVADNGMANAMDANMAAPAAMPPTTAEPATPADTVAAPATETRHGFPWGVLGLIGLIGLFGVRKMKG